MGRRVLVLGAMLTAMGCASAQAPETRTPTATKRATPAPAYATAEASESLDPLDIALRLYAAERYHEAAAAFRRAYESEGTPAALFAEAQARRLAGECGMAATLYETYLDLQHDPTANNAVRPLVATCSDR